MHLVFDQPTADAVWLVISIENLAEGHYKTKDLSTIGLDQLNPYMSEFMQEVVERDLRHIEDSGEWPIALPRSRVEWVDVRDSPRPNHQVRVSVCLYQDFQLRSTSGDVIYEKVNSGIRHTDFYWWNDRYLLDATSTELLYTGEESKCVE